MTDVKEHKGAPTRHSPRPRAGERADRRRRPDPEAIEQWVRKARQLPAVREELVQRVRAEIEAGEYETPEKLQRAIDRLMDELREQ